MNYKIITDKNKLLEFIDWLPELDTNEIFYLCLFARNKYYDKLAHIRSDKAQIKRFTSDKVRMYSKIKQLEIEIGSYYQFINKDTIEVNSIPQQALALYMHPNPRNVENATFESIKDLTTCLQTKNKGFNPVQQVYSAIQKSIGNKKYVTFDIDGMIDIDLDFLYKIVPKEAIKIIKTRGGFHLLVESKHESLKDNNKWYQHIVNLYSPDQKGDMMSPIPGTIQGNFTPYFI